MPRNQSFDKLKNNEGNNTYSGIDENIVKKNISKRIVSKKLKKTRNNTLGSKFFRFLVRATLICSFLGVSLVAGAGIALWSFSSKLPDVRKIEQYTPSEASEIYDANGHILARLHDEENRTVVPLKQIPLILQQSVIAMEDERFYEHFGVDPRGVVRMFAAFLDKSMVRGGASTITQQLARNLFLTQDVKATRKIAEWILAVKMEKYFSKQKILELYLNQVYWGHNAYGVEAASKTFFGKPANNLSLAEASMMGGLLSSPEVYSPHYNFKLAKWRQSLTLQNMVRLHFITKKQADQAKNTKIVLQSMKTNYKIAHPYFTTYVISVLEEKYGDSLLRKGGLKIYTTMDERTQTFAEEMISRDIPRLKISNNVGQAALISIDPNTGFIRTIVGGTSFEKSQFNRATQAKRQPGSSFKPFVYLTAFKEGILTPDSTDNDAPITYPDMAGSWSPKNFGGTYSGYMTIRSAVKNSVNTIAVKTIDKVGVDKVIETAKTVGIESYIGPNLSVALGSSEVTPIEMASAYGVFATGGKKPKQITPILRIEDRNGNIIADYSYQELEQVVNHRAVDMLNDVLTAVVDSGSGTGAAMYGRYVAGKTGTTSEHRDSWFVGYTPQLSTAIWIGNDDNSRMWNTTGGQFCAPIWRKYMEFALKGLPSKNFVQAGPKDPPINQGKSRGVSGTQSYVAPQTTNTTKPKVENTPKPEESVEPKDENVTPKDNETNSNNIEVKESSKPVEVTDLTVRNRSNGSTRNNNIVKPNMNGVNTIDKEPVKKVEPKVIEKKEPVVQPVAPKKEPKKKVDEELNRAVEDLNSVKELYNQR